MDLVAGIAPQALLDAFPFPCVLVNERGNRLFANARFLALEQAGAVLQGGGDLGPFLRSVIEDSSCPQRVSLRARDAEPRHYEVLASTVSRMSGRRTVLIVFRDVEQEYEILKEKNLLARINDELSAIFAELCDEVFVSRADGVVLWVGGKSSGELYGVDPEDLVGKNVFDLVKQGFYYPSAFPGILQEKRTVSFLQTTQKGVRLAVTCVPIIDSSGQVVRVISYAKKVREDEFSAACQGTGVEIPAPFINEGYRIEGIVAASPAMKNVIDLVHKVAAVNSTVLILGESGVGKEVVAKAIHRLSKRRDGPFVQINCGALPESLIESELFGYESGAFTGARKTGKPGLIELASGGTVFLDEIADMPLHLQVKLLGVLQSKKVCRIGGSREIEVDVRVIAATNRDIAAMVRNGSFRSDLYYRLNVIPIYIPPVRERPEDIPALIRHFVAKFNAAHGTKSDISQEAMRVLLAYHWPGNVRQIENVVERLLVLYDGNPPLEALAAQGLLPTDGEGRTSPIRPLRKVIEEVEARAIEDAWRVFKNTYKVAEVLGVSQSTVVRRLRKYGVTAR